MSDDPADWARHLADNLTVDPSVPPGISVLRSGIDQAIAVSDSARYVGTLAVSDVLAEEYRSLGESAPFIVRYSEAGPAVTCECCGARVAQMPEREGPRGRPWKPGIWETGGLRKHTMRRCEWKRVN